MQKKELNKRFLEKKQIETARLILRRICRTDAEDMFAYASLPCVTRYLTWQEHPDILHTKRYLAYLDTRYRVGQFFDFAIVLRDSGRMIGTIGFVSFDENNSIGEVGYVLHPDFWNQGIMTEALGALIRFGFEELSLHRIEATYMPENLASRRVMEKCGMTFEGIRRGTRLVKGNYIDVGICAILSEDISK
jgi:ribosomal-protein-alanine N-acetyltransferase